MMFCNSLVQTEAFTSTHQQRHDPTPQRSRTWSGTTQLVRPQVAEDTVRRIETVRIIEIPYLADGYSLDASEWHISWTCDASVRFLAPLLGRSIQRHPNLGDAKEFSVGRQVNIRELMRKLLKQWSQRADLNLITNRLLQLSYVGFV